MASISSHSSITCINDTTLASLVANRHNPTFATTQFKMACRQLNEYQLQATHRRQAHLEDCTRHAAATSNTSTEQALLNIIKAETTKATFSKLRSQVKGKTFLPLQQGEIPVLDEEGRPTNNTESITDAHLLSQAILSQNKQHFSQASNTHGAGGLLSTLIPPFSHNHVTNAILDGSFNLLDVDPIPEVQAFLESMAIPQELKGLGHINITILQPIFSQASVISQIRPYLVLQAAT